MSYWYHIKMKTRLIMVNTLFFFHRNTLISFMVTLFIRRKLKRGNFIQGPASRVFAAVSEYWFSGFSRLSIYKLITTVIALLIAFLININNKKLDQIISKLLTSSKYFTCRLILFYNIFDHPLRVVVITISTNWCLFKWNNQNWWTNQISQSVNSKAHSW